jgi:plasmid stabilization system protein ParE
VKLRFTRRALGDLQRLRAFINKDNPQAAAQVGAALRRSIARLVDQPRIGLVLEYPPGVRRWVAGSYVVHYIIEDESLTVLRIWHGREQRPEV